MKPTPQQQKIFDWFETGSGHLVVRARAGTGKTTTILKGIERAPENRILVTAFNKRIVKEAGVKIGCIDWPAKKDVQANTLNSIGDKICRASKSQMDKDKLHKLLQEVMTGDDLKYKGTAVKDLVGKAKGMAPFAETWEDILPIVQEFQIKVSTWPDPKEERRLAEWAIRLMKLCLVNDRTYDFDDQIFLPLRLGWAQPTYDLVVVDEAQDMNYAQNEFAVKIARSRVCVVGDDRQAIYRFRGADVHALDRMGTLLKAKEEKLTFTFRCAKVIVAKARVLVPDFEAGPNNPEGEILHATIDQIFKMAQPGDVILSRKNAPLMRLCLSFWKQNVNAGIAGLDLLAQIKRFIEKTLRPTSIEGLLRSLDEWVKKEVAKVKARKQSEDKETEILDKAEVVRSVALEADTVPEVYALLDRLFANEDAPQGDPCDPAEAKPSGILLSSVHKAKGLEWKRVFLLEDTFNTRNLEEKNIRYVAITRAKSTLILVGGTLGDK